MHWWQDVVKYVLTGWWKCIITKWMELLAYLHHLVFHFTICPFSNPMMSRNTQTPQSLDQDIVGCRLGHRRWVMHWSLGWRLELRDSYVTTEGVGVTLVPSIVTWRMDWLRRDQSIVCVVSWLFTLKQKPEGTRLLVTVWFLTPQF